MKKKLILFISMLMVCTGCTEFAMLSSTAGIAVSNNVYAKTYSNVGVLSKEIFDVPLSLSKTIEYLVEKEIKKVKKAKPNGPAKD